MCEQSKGMMGGKALPEHTPEQLMELFAAASDRPGPSTASEMMAAYSNRWGTKIAKDALTSADILISSADKDRRRNDRRKVKGKPPLERIGGINGVQLLLFAVRAGYISPVDAVAHLDRLSADRAVGQCRDRCDTAAYRFANAAYNYLHCRGQCQEKECEQRFMAESASWFGALESVKAPVRRSALLGFRQAMSKFISNAAKLEQMAGGQPYIDRFQLVLLAAAHSILDPETFAYLLRSEHVAAAQAAALGQGDQPDDD